MSRFAYINRITKKRAELLNEYNARVALPPHPRVGVWRHQMNMELLKNQIERLEKKRFMLARLK